MKKNLLFIFTLLAMNPVFASNSLCENCEAFRSIDQQKIQPYSEELKKAINVLYDFKFSKSTAVRQAQIKEYINFAVRLMDADQNAEVMDYANQAYRKDKDNFDAALKQVDKKTRKTFLEQVNQAQSLATDGDDGLKSF